MKEGSEYTVSTKAGPWQSLVRVQGVNLLESLFTARGQINSLKYRTEQPNHFECKFEASLFL